MKSKNLLAFWLLLTCHFFTAFPQTTSNVTDNNTVKKGTDILYAELMGNSGVYSINYERIFHSGKVFQFSSRIGFGCFPIAYKGEYADGFVQNDFLSSNIVIPVEGIFSFGKKASHFETGIGCTQLIRWTMGVEEPLGISRLALSTSYYIGPVINVGYRYEKKEGGFFLRAGVSTTVLFATNSYEDTLFGSSPLPFPQVCLGYKFFKRVK